MKYYRMDTFQEADSPRRTFKLGKDGGKLARTCGLSPPALLASPAALEAIGGLISKWR